MAKTYVAVYPRYSDDVEEKVDCYERDDRGRKITVTGKNEDEALEKLLEKMQKLHPENEYEITMSDGYKTVMAKSSFRNASRYGLHLEETRSLFRGR